MDQRGKGKIKKADFQSAVERIRISISRDDINKVWNNLDEKGVGYILLADLHQAFSSKMSHNLNKGAEMAIGQQAAN